MTVAQKAEAVDKAQHFTVEELITGLISSRLSASALC